MGENRGMGFTSRMPTKVNSSYVFLLWRSAEALHHRANNTCSEEKDVLLRDAENKFRQIELYLGQRPHNYEELVELAGMKSATFNGYSMD